MSGQHGTPADERGCARRCRPALQECRGATAAARRQCPSRGLPARAAAATALLVLSLGLGAAAAASRSSAGAASVDSSGWWSWIAAASGGRCSGGTAEADKKATPRKMRRKRPSCRISRVACAEPRVPWRPAPDACQTHESAASTGARHAQEPSGSAVQVKTLGPSTNGPVKLQSGPPKIGADTVQKHPG